MCSCQGRPRLAQGSRKPKEPKRGRKGRGSTKKPDQPKPPKKKRQNTKQEGFSPETPGAIHGARMDPPPSGSGGSAFPPPRPPWALAAGVGTCKAWPPAASTVPDRHSWGCLMALTTKTQAHFPNPPRILLSKRKNKRKGTRLAERSMDERTDDEIKETRSLWLPLKEPDLNQEFSTYHPEMKGIHTSSICSLLDQRCPGTS